MNRVVLFSILCMLLIGASSANAQDNGKAKEIIYSKPYHIYTPYYESSDKEELKHVIFIHEEQPVKTKKQKKEKQQKNKDKNMVLAINTGLGFNGDLEYKMTFGIEIAYPVAKRFGLGVFLSPGFSLEKQSSRYGLYSKSEERMVVGDVPIQVGLLTTIGNYHDRKAACLLGLGYEMEDGCNNACFRLGVILRNGFMLSTNLSGGEGDFSMTLNLGYNFGALFKVK